MYIELSIKEYLNLGGSLSKIELETLYTKYDGVNLDVCATSIYGTVEIDKVAITTDVRLREVFKTDELFTQIKINSLPETYKEDWVLLADEIPTVEQHGEKVIIYRILNDSQILQQISIHDTVKTKYCNPNETWWRVMPAIPKPPKIN